MSGPHHDTGTRDEETRPISVAELLARNGTIGSPPVSGRRRRRRGNTDAVTVAELTGEIPIIRDTGEIPVVRDDEQQPDKPAAETPEASETPAQTPAASVQTDAAAATESSAGGRFPKSPPPPQRSTGPQRSEYPRPIRQPKPAPAPNGQPARRQAPEIEAEPAPPSGAEQMRPDPVDTSAETKADDTDVRAEQPLEDSAYVRSVLRAADRAEAVSTAARPGGPAIGAGFDEEPAAGLDEDHADIETDLADRPEPEPGLLAEVWGGAVIVLQSMLAVAFGAGLFIAFDQLWRWNNVAALVLTVLVTLGLVAAVQVVRKTVDIVSTLIAVAVGLLVTLGPLALHAT